MNQRDYEYQINRELTKRNLQPLNVINKYPNIQRMPIFGYSVRILQYYKDLPIISIEGAEVTDKCPGCGASLDDARYLRTEEENHNKDFDIVSSTCLDCGTVYMSEQPNERVCH